MHRPSIPRALRRTATAAALAAAVTVPIGTQTAALAQTKGAGNGTETAVPAPAQVADCPHSTKKYFNGNAEARLYCRYTNRYEVQGWFHNNNRNYSITGWVEQRSGNGPYRRITFLYPVNASYTAQTGWHEDNFPKQARACFRFSFPGAATHCTDPFGAQVEWLAPSGAGWPEAVNLDEALSSGIYGAASSVWSGSPSSNETPGSGTWGTGGAR